MTAFLHAAWNGAVRHWLGLFIPTERVFGLYVVSMVVIAWLVWRSRRRHAGETRGFLAYAFDRKVYGHRSARQRTIFYYFANGSDLLLASVAQLLELLERPSWPCSRTAR